ncbi:GTP cyclohydrolase I FolE2 [Aliidiomarina minuta]|uniref:GTP cyclohydrolase I FolE2 n=1 Tax=Aliidiomarina minuta TaxID=880057 RepID=A0A432WBD3_9GAMM|nr:GTP cyclohydrolase FolE2 [Aliidiomarina minuta]RUO26898.1 GTP cyclohydrolase I FolE2 [Aliidiomarina minuta]
MSYRSPMSDITSTKLGQSESALKWVGMEKIALPVLLPVDNQNQALTHCYVDTFVGLEKKSAKGIHMSRLYRLLNELFSHHLLTNKLIRQYLTQSIIDQNGISKSSRVAFSFELALQKKALVSEFSGYQFYPCKIDVQFKQQKFFTSVHLTIPYSSTCPCSAGLAREGLTEQLDAVFEHESINKAQLLDWINNPENAVPTPHSQRSFAEIELCFEGVQIPDLSALVNQFEQVIGTPLQTAVKRVDEKQFAENNGANLLFCEDAARRIKASIEGIEGLVSYNLKVRHLESLHAHDAVVIDYY